MILAALYGEQMHMLMVIAARSRSCSSSRSLRPRRAHVAWAIAATYLRRPLGRGARWPTRCCCADPARRRAPDRRADRDVHRRHHRVLRRAHVRPHAARSARSRRTRRWRGCVAGVIGGTVAFWCAGLYQDWLTGVDALLIGALRGLGGARRRPVRVDAQARPGREGRRNALRAPRRRARSPRRGLLQRLVAYYTAHALGYG